MEVKSPALDLMQVTASRSRRRQEVVLLLGDWLVDEHWLFGVHRSSTASRTGIEHLRALHGPDSAVQSFCGAGRSAYFLYQLYRRDDGEPPLTSVLGLGLWHQKDTAALKSLFDPAASPNNLFRLTPALLATPAGVELINMNDSLHVGDRMTPRRERYEYTTRIIRVYRMNRGRLEYERLDWEPDHGPAKWTKQALNHMTSALKAALRGKHVSAILIKDMRKGAVLRETVQWLVKEAPKEARWYVSSKNWAPDWLDALRSVHLRLYMIPQVAAKEAIRRRELSSWLTASGHPSKEALKLIDTLARASHAENIFVLPDDSSAISYSAGSDAHSFVHTKLKTEEATVEMGGASIVFPAFVACMEHKMSVKDSTVIALKTANEWVDWEAQRILKPLAWKPDTKPAFFKQLRKDLLKTEPSLHADFGEVSPRLSWQEQRREWRESFTDLGIVHHGDKVHEFQLWRAMLEVEGYVCCDDAKRRRLRELLQGIQGFAQSGRHHASCMLVAGPGTGKSFLAMRLAETAGLEYVAFNITQLRTKGDVVECFDRITAEQSRTGKRFLVFMDEINADLDGDPVYSAFLTPLEDGTYVRNGRTVSIRPCVWVFAGTEPPKPNHRALRDRDASKSTKRSDFVSRLTLGVFDLGQTSAKRRSTTTTRTRRNAVESLERVYLGVSLLKNEFSEIDTISEAVLRAFSELPPELKARDIKHFVRRFGEIQYGRVTARNVPEWWPGDQKRVIEMRWQSRVSRKIYSDDPNIQIVTG